MAHQITVSGESPALRLARRGAAGANTAPANREQVHRLPLLQTPCPRRQEGSELSSDSSTELTHPLQTRPQSYPSLFPRHSPKDSELQGTAVPPQNHPLLPGPFLNVSSTVTAYQLFFLPASGKRDNRLELGKKKKMYELLLQKAHFVVISKLRFRLNCVKIHKTWEAECPCESVSPTGTPALPALPKET